MAPMNNVNLAYGFKFRHEWLGWAARGPMGSVIGLIKEQTPFCGQSPNEKEACG